MVYKFITINGDVENEIVCVCKDKKIINLKLKELKLENESVQCVKLNID